MDINNRNINIRDLVWVNSGWWPIIDIDPRRRLFTLDYDNTALDVRYDGVELGIKAASWTATNFESYWFSDTDWISEYVYDNNLDGWEERKDRDPRFYFVDSDTQYLVESGWSNPYNEQYACPDLIYMENVYQAQLERTDFCVWCGRGLFDGVYCDKVCFDLHGQSNEIFWILARESASRMISIDELIKFINNNQ